MSKHEQSIAPQAELLEGIEAPLSLEALAFRDGDPVSWEQPEYGFQVASRLCHVLGVEQITDEIWAAADKEGDRQTAVFNGVQREVRRIREERELAERTERGMGLTATLLVEALVSPDDPRNRDEIRELVLRALGPIQKEIEAHEYEPIIIR